METEITFLKGNNSKDKGSAFMVHITVLAVNGGFSTKDQNNGVKCEWTTLKTCI